MEDLKAYSIRMPKDLWKFLKKESMEQEVSMNSIILECIIRYKNKLKKG
jgi:predicted HicB family RNase H-like nuclease